MIIIGCDFHTRIQQIAMLDPTTGEIIERCLDHQNDEVERFYAALPSPARVGIEATINARWFEKILDRYHHELWIGDAAEIRAARANRRRILAMPGTFWICCWPTGFHELDALSGRTRPSSTFATSSRQKFCTERIGDSDCSVVHALPKRKESDLFEGEIWIDNQDFAIVKIIGHLAKSPSFWIKQVDFSRNYQKVDGFWLLASEEAVSEIRIFGKETLTVDYENYAVNGSGGIQSRSSHEYDARADWR